MQTAPSPVHRAARIEDGHLALEVGVDPTGVARLALGIRDGGVALLDDEETGIPLLDVMTAGTGRRWAGRRYAESAPGHRLRYVDHTVEREGAWQRLRVTVADPDAGLTATLRYELLTGRGVLRSSVEVRNTGTAPLAITSLSSLLISGLEGRGGSLDDVDVLWAENDWKAESRWTGRAFRDALPALSARDFTGISRGRLELSSIGSWSSGSYLPMGATVNRRTGYTLLWQIEHNGSWLWQVGDRGELSDRGLPLDDHPRAQSFLALLGPTDVAHHWQLTLEPDETFTSVPVAIAVSGEGLESAAGQLTAYRRAIRRPHPDHQHRPLIFNDYLNTLNADPSAELLVPLIDAAARVGSQTFCIDAGWYAAPGEWWWDAVGEWRPSAVRFPGGFARIIDHIRERGMVPGIWIEPEVIGVRSPVAEMLPAEAFFMRGGERVVEQGRYHLDLRHPAAREHLDQTIDFLVDELGIGYIKMDYNVDIAPGTDVGELAPGVGLLGHNRALLTWIDDVLRRHPGLTLESCASGGMRTDYAMLTRCQLHSTSDQDDPLQYPPIAVSAPLAVAPDQAGVWAVPQPQMSDDLIAFTMCGPLLNRLNLTGHLDHMTDAQRALVARALDVQRDIADDLRDAAPFWPLGLPGWNDGWLALGMRTATRSYLTVWRRTPTDPSDLTLRLQAHGGSPQLLYGGDGAHVAAADDGDLVVTLPRAPSACLIAVDAELRVRDQDPGLGVIRRSATTPTPTTGATR